MMTVEEYVQRLLADDEAGCLAEGRAYSVDIEGLHRFYIEIVGPSQYLIGEMWQDGAITSDDEKIATALNNYVTAACHAPLSRVRKGSPRGLVACTPDEQHELGPRILADLLECDGWDVIFVGPVPSTEALLESIHECNPRFIGLSTSLPIHLGAARSCITELRDVLGDATPPIIVGGGAYQADGALWQRLGADFYAEDALIALDRLRELQT